jgi:hypothetical protein
MSQGNVTHRIVTTPNSNISGNGTVNITSAIDGSNIDPAALNQIITDTINADNAGTVAQITAAVQTQLNIAPQTTTIINNTTNNFIFGQPVYSLEGYSVDLAVATNIDKKDLIGIISSDSILSGGGLGNILFSGKLTGTTQQWDAVTSMIGGLVPNKKYFLDINTGLLTINVPTDIGQFICQVGRAISTTELIIKIEQPITI